VRQRHVCGVAALRDEDTTDPGGVVARVKGVPTVAQINFNPCGKIHRSVRRRQADVSDVTSAIARRNVQATAKGDCKMRVVAANTATLFMFSGATATVALNSRVSGPAVSSSTSPARRTHGTIDP